MGAGESEPVVLHDDSRRLHEFLSNRCDELRIARFEPAEIARELTLEPERLEWCLEELYASGMVIYWTRVNKDTGEKLKVVQLLSDDEE